jgi:amino acid transporter, AAT family
MNVSIDSENNFNYLFGLINLAVVFCIVWLLWYVFLHPNAVMKLYTPMYGFSLIVALLTVIVLMNNVAGYYPFAESAPEGTGLFTRGIILTVVSILLMLVLVYGFFWGFIGKFGIAYFSPKSIIASGGIGAEIFVARENASTAIVYFCTAFLWLAIFWRVGFNRWPWQNADRGVLAWSRLFAILFFVSIAYIVLFHPHVCYLFYPAQSKAGVEPWWAEFAGTGSAFFSLGLVLCSLFWIIASDLLWEGYPWKLMEKDGEGTFLKGVVAFFATLVLGMILLFILFKVMNYFWDEAFMGGQYTDGPDFRYIHAGEIGGFFILSAFILKNYFNNFPNFGGIWSRAIIRTAIAVIGGMVIYLFYFSAASTFFLGKVYGFAQPGDTPLVWTILFLCVIMVQCDFFEGWPLKKAVGVETDAAEISGEMARNTA